jgi:transposase
MRAYSVDLRERVVAAVDGGMTQEQAAATFGVSVNTVGRYLGRRRATGSLAPTVQRHGPKPEKKRRLHAWLPARLQVAADATLAEHAAAFTAEHGVAVSPATMSRAIASLPATIPVRADIQQLDPTSLVFVDECGTHTSMTRRRARAPRGTRARGAVPRNRGPVTTLIAGLSLAGMSPAMTVVGGTTAAVFATYLEKVLIPALQPGQVVVVDNVGAHKPDRMRSLVEAAGCRLIFLPAYSPDLSPVEEAFSKIKTVVKAAAARTRAALDAAIAAALAAVTAGDAAGWFAHAGYFTPQTT